MTQRPPLSTILALDYRFESIADPDGGFVIRFPDLPGCLTQVETIEEIAAAAAEIKELWIETEYERGKDIPLPH